MDLCNSVPLEGRFVAVGNFMKGEIRFCQRYRILLAFLLTFPIEPQGPGYTVFRTMVNCKLPTPYSACEHLVCSESLCNVISKD